VAEAIEEYRRLVNWNPSDLSTLNTLGDLCARAGRNEEAKLTFSRVAQGYRHQGFTSKAIAVLKKVLRIDPADLDAVAKLAECYATQGQTGEAVRQYLSIAEAHERAGCEYKALEAYQKAADTDASNTSLLTALGDRWLREGLCQQAHASFMSAADSFSQRGDDERALAAYLKARLIEPDEHRTLSAIAAICAARGQADSAVPILSESLERNSGDVELYRMLGASYMSAGRIDDAARTFSQLLALDESEYDNLLVVSARYLEIGELDRALQQIDELIDILIANQEEQKAVDFLREVLDSNPNHEGSLKRLALIFGRLREDYNLVPTLKALVGIALRRGDRDGAIEMLKELCALEPFENEHREALRRQGVELAAIPYAFDYADQNSPARVVSEDLLTNAAPESSRRGAWIKQASRTSALDAYEFVPSSDLGESAGRTQWTTSHMGDANNSCTDFELVRSGNRRRAERKLVRLPLIVVSNERGWREFTETVDVSETGMRVRLAHFVAPLTLLSMSLEKTKWSDTLANLNRANATTAIVRYSQPLPGGINLVGFELEPEPQRFVAPTAVEQPGKELSLPV